jgi:hypothetical protein
VPELQVVIAGSSNGGLNAPISREDINRFAMLSGRIVT